MHLGREIYRNTKLQVDKFSEKCPPRQWAGLEAKQKMKKN